MQTLAVAGFVLAHALIHAGYLSPRPPAKPGAPAWPFELERSRLAEALGIHGPLPRPLGWALVALTIAGYGLAVVAVLAALPSPVWAAGMLAGSLGSLAVLTLFFHPWLVLGIGIDVVLLYAVLVAGWTPAGLGA